MLRATKPESTMPFVRPDVQNILTMLAAQAAPPTSTMSPADARTSLAMLVSLAEHPRPDLAEIRDIALPGQHGHTIPARIYRNSLSADPAPVMAFYHGGGFVIGDIPIYDSLCAEIASTLNMTVVSVDYRLAPEHRFPAATEDCLAATQWLASSPAELGHPVTGIVPAGDSAGGNLAAVISQQLAHKLSVPILAQWLIYPVTDATAAGGSMEEFGQGYLLTADTMAWFFNHYVPEGTDPAHPYASPINTASLEGQPPTLVYTCSLDPLRDQGRAYAGKLIAAGVRTIFREASGQVHFSFNLRGAIPSAQDDLHACLRDLKILMSEA
jgi:acetyl esterase